MNIDQGRYGDYFSDENQSGISPNKPNSDAWICPSCETVNYEETCEVCGFSKPSEDENSHVHKNKKTRVKRSVITTIVIVSLLIVGFFTVHFWTEGSCTEDSHCKLCGKIRTTAPGHQWNNATCTSAKTCKVCGEIEGAPRAHNWRVATCVDPKTCRDCGKTSGTALTHSWQEATCTQPATCIRCGLTTGTNSHTWTSNSTDVRKTCSLCLKQVEFFYSPQDGELLAWTEYEMVNYKPINPVSYSAGDEKRIDWEDITEGEVFQGASGEGVHLFYVKGKIYYFDLVDRKIDENIAYNLAIVGSRYTSVTRYLWEEDDVLLSVDLAVDYINELMSYPIPDIVGWAIAAFDADGTQYVIVRILDSDKVYAVRSNWKN